MSGYGKLPSKIFQLESDSFPSEYIFLIIFLMRFGFKLIRTGNKYDLQNYFSFFLT